VSLSSRTGSALDNRLVTSWQRNISYLTAISNAIEMPSRVPMNAPWSSRWDGTTHSPLFLSWFGRCRYSDVLTWSGLSLALGGPDRPWAIHPFTKVQPHWLLWWWWWRRWWWEGFKKQVSRQARGDCSFGDPLLEVRQSLSHTGVILEMAEGVLLDQSPQPNLLLGPPAALQFTAGQHGVPVRLHLCPDLWDALTGVWGGAHHLKRKSVGRDACVNLKGLFFNNQLEVWTIRPSGLGLSPRAEQTALHSVFGMGSVMWTVVSYLRFCME